MFPSIRKWTLTLLLLDSSLFCLFFLFAFNFESSKSLSERLSIITKPLFSSGTNKVLLTCNPASSCRVDSIPFSCLDDTTKFGSLLRIPSSVEISTTIRPKALAGGTYNPPLSYLAPIQVQLAASEPLEEHIMYAFFPESTKGFVKFLNIVASFVEVVVAYGSSSIMLEEEMNTLSVCLATWSVKVKGIIICSNPSNLLKIDTLCFLFSKVPSFSIRNRALWNGLKAIGLSSDKEEALIISSDVAIKIDFFGTGISST